MKKSSFSISLTFRQKMRLLIIGFGAGFLTLIGSFWVLYSLNDPTARQSAALYPLSTAETCWVLAVLAGFFLMLYCARSIKKFRKSWECYKSDCREDCQRCLGEAHRPAV